MADYSGVFWMKVMVVRDIKREYPYAEIDPRWDDAEEKKIVFGFLPGDPPVEFAFSEDGDILLYHRELFAHERSVVAAVFNNEGDSTYGVGFGAQMLPEIQTLNEMRKDNLRAQKLQANPMFIVGDGAVDDEEIVAQAGGMIRVRPDPINGSLPFQALPVSGNPQVAFAGIQDSQQRIKDGFRQMPQAADPRHPVQTATAIIVAKEQEMEDSDEPMLAFRDLIVEPVIKQTVELMRQNGMVPKWLVVRDDIFRLEMRGMEERSKRASTLERIMAAADIAQRMPPEIAAVSVKWQEMYHEALGVLGLEKLRMTPEEASMRLAEMQQAAQQQQQAVA